MGSLSNGGSLLLGTGRNWTSGTRILFLAFFLASYFLFLRYQPLSMRVRSKLVYWCFVWISGYGLGWKWHGPLAMEWCFHC